MCAFKPAFFMTAYEMRQACIAVHDEISDHTRFKPPSMEAMLARINIAKNHREAEETDGKDAEQRGDTVLASRCRAVVTEIDEILAIWTQRWKEI